MGPVRLDTVDFILTTRLKTKISFTSNRLLPESSGLLDPMQIPARVRNSLLDMHYHLHQKPGLLQTSRISKSDSNIKVPRGNVFLDESKKLLSLQKSTCD
mgnify:CR=1 FL=1